MIRHYTYRTHLADMPAYTPIEPFDVLSKRLNRQPGEIAKLDANENLYGPAPTVHEALARLEYPHIYPDPESRELRDALAEFTGVPAANLIAGAGADELIDLLIRVLVEPGDCVLDCPPTFGMYSFDTLINGSRLLQINRLADFSLNVKAILDTIEQFHPQVLFIASPNNPDGSILTPELYKNLIELPLLIVIDEAYIEFSGQGDLGAQTSLIRQVPSRNNLIVLRTFSKWAGLAGLRIGYGAFPAWLMPVLWKSKQPYNVNVAASTAALASLQALDHLSGNIAKIIAERERLFAAVSAVEWLTPYPSQANFILCRVNGRNAAEIKDRLAWDYGILVRYFNRPGLDDHIRISVGRTEDTDRLIMALHQL